MKLDRNMIQTIAGLVLVFALSLYATCVQTASAVNDGGVSTDANHAAADAAEGD